MNIDVVCVLRTGGGHYDTDYVMKLYEGLQRHTPLAKLHCMTNAPKWKLPQEVEHIKLLEDWPSWWSKIELFDRDLWSGQVLYMDLDTLVTGDIAPLMLKRHRFTALRNFLNTKHGMGSGLMAWDVTGFDVHRIFDTFKQNPSKWIQHCRTSDCWGDQGFIRTVIGNRIDYWQDLYPGAVQSVKVQADRSKAKIICFHGKPRPRDTGWQLPFEPGARPLNPRLARKLARRGIA